MMPRPERQRIAGLGLALLVASSAAGCMPSRSAQSTPAEGSVITAEELRRVGDRDAYTAIELLRPHFLRYRGQTGFRSDARAEPDVFVDGMYYGPMASLRRLPVRELAEIRFLSVGDATMRYGMGHLGGVIDITSIH
jgi:hypothetical protein